LTTSYQKDIRVAPAGNTGYRVTIALSETGDIQLVEGSNKLGEQLVRAVVNDDTIKNGIALNSVVTVNYINSLFTVILRNFRQSQISQTNTVDPKCIGFSLFRYGLGAANTDYVRVSKHPVTWKFVDVNLENGSTYSYGLTRNYSDGFESAVLEQVSVTPSQFAVNQNPIIGSNVVVLPDNQSATFYVDYNKQYTRAELLEEIDSIAVQQDVTEPRRYTVSITVVNLAGNKVPIASSRFNPSKG
jgi:hypothetical protein